MAYETKEWKARKGTGLDRFRLRGWNDEPAIRLVSTPDSVTQEGDTLSEANLNGLESRIAGAFATLPPIREVFEVQENREMGMDRYNRLVANPCNALKDADGNIYRALFADKGAMGFWPYHCMRISGGNIRIYELKVYEDSYVDYREEWAPSVPTTTKFYEHNIIITYNSEKMSVRITSNDSTSITTWNQFAKSLLDAGYTLGYVLCHGRHSGKKTLGISTDRRMTSITCHTDNTSTGRVNLNNSSSFSCHTRGFN